MIGPQIKMPKRGATAFRTEVKADRAPLLNIADIKFARPFNANLGFQVVSARVENRARSPLTCLAVQTFTIAGSPDAIARREPHWHCAVPSIAPRGKFTGIGD